MTAPTEIHLLKPHRHAGRNYPAGSTLTLPQRKAAWLIGIGTATVGAPAAAAIVGAGPSACPADGQPQGGAPTGARRASRKSKETTTD